jgi:hypothetical protein
VVVRWSKDINAIFYYVWVALYFLWTHEIDSDLSRKQKVKDHAQQKEHGTWNNEVLRVSRLANTNRRLNRSKRGQSRRIISHMKRWSSIKYPRWCTWISRGLSLSARKISHITSRTCRWRVPSSKQTPHLRNIMRSERHSGSSINRGRAVTSIRGSRM